MNRVLNKLDMLLGAVIGAAGGMMLSQAQAFTNAYLQRLGGHLDEASLTLQRIRNGDMLATVSDVVRSEAVREQTVRVQELRALFDTISGTDPLLRPLALLRYGDMSIAERAATEFVPSLPLDLASAVYTALGVVLGLVVYEILKLPRLAVGRSRRGDSKRQSRHPSQVA